MSFKRSFTESLLRGNNFTQRRKERRNGRKDIKNGGDEF